MLICCVMSQMRTSASFSVQQLWQALLQVVAFDLWDLLDLLLSAIYGLAVPESTLHSRCAGATQPHPNAGCVLVHREGHVLAQAYQRAQVRETPANLWPPLDVFNGKQSQCHTPQYRSKQAGLRMHKSMHGPLLWFFRAPRVGTA